MKPDQETKEVISEQEKLKMLVESAGWNIALNRLTKKFNDFSSINTLVLEDRKSDDIVAELSNRMAVVDIIKSWISELYGEADILEDTLESLKDETNIELYTRK